MVCKLTLSGVSKLGNCWLGRSCDVPFVKTNSSRSLPYAAQLMVDCYLKVWESSFQIPSLSEKNSRGGTNNENKCTRRTGQVTSVQKSTAWCAPKCIAGNSVKSKLTQDTERASVLLLLAVLGSWRGKQYQLCFSSPMRGVTVLKYFLSLEKETAKLHWKVWLVVGGSSSSSWWWPCWGRLRGTDKSHRQREQCWCAKCRSAAEVVGVQAIPVSPSDHKTLSFYLVWRWFSDST